MRRLIRRWSTKLVTRNKAPETMAEGCCLIVQGQFCKQHLPMRVTKPGAQTFS